MRIEFYQWNLLWKAKNLLYGYNGDGVEKDYGEIKGVKKVFQEDFLFGLWGEVGSKSPTRTILE